MASIRVKLTAAYAVALVGTMAAFSGALWVGRGAGVYRELQRHVFAQAQIGARMIRRAEELGLPIMETADSLVGSTLTAELTAQLQVLPGYVLVLDSAGRAVYISPAARRLDLFDFETLSSTALRLTTTRLVAVLTINGQEILLASQEVDSSRSAVRRVVAGASTSATKLSGRELLGTMLAIAPLLLAMSVGGAYVIAGRAFRPVDRIINEVEAITDGRSLHRRLALDEGGDELARLSVTLNAMIGRLENSFGALRRFTADASHELKTPLTVLRADVERAMSAPSGGTEQLVALEEALAETRRMADLVDSLLTLARADEGRFDLHREAVSLAALLLDVHETAHILGEGAGIAVSMPDCEDATVLGDATRLRQLLLNLVTNAIKYTPTGGRVELWLRAAGPGLAQIGVRDTGIGIAAADVPYIFERFWRADRARSRAAERGGFGLGLAISQYIAQAHGGTLAVQSRLTRGTTFTLTLPVEVPLPSTGEEPPGGAAGERLGGDGVQGVTAS